MPSGLLDKTSSKEELDGRTKIAQPCETSLFKIDFYIPKSIATIFNFLVFSE